VILGAQASPNRQSSCSGAPSRTAGATAPGGKQPPAPCNHVCWRVSASALPARAILRSESAPTAIFRFVAARASAARRGALRGRVRAELAARAGDLRRAPARDDLSRGGTPRCLSPQSVQELMARCAAPSRRARRGELEINRARSSASGFRVPRGGRRPRLGGIQSFDDTTLDASARAPARARRAHLGPARGGFGASRST